MKHIPVCLLAFALLCPPVVSAQSVDGYVSFLADLLPHVVSAAADERTVGELRTRVFAEHRRNIGRIKLTASGFVDLLAARRQPGEVTTAAIVRPQELHIEASWAKADVRMGFTRIVWGRLDEFLPTDVVNPQDLTRFFLEGRSEGRMATAMVRGRWLPTDRFTLEGIYVPAFRRGRFDELDEKSSPFNIKPRQLCSSPAMPCVEVNLRSLEPRFALRSAQGGARASITSGRVDWALSLYRGFEPLPIHQAARVSPLDPIVIEEHFPRFTMIGGDFETVRGEWGIRGEMATFVERTLQRFDQPLSVRGRAVEGGIGVDRKAGEYRVSGNVVITRQWALDPMPGAVDLNRTDATLVGAVDRSFKRETRRLRAFAVYNPAESTGFTRVIGAISMRDNVWIESSGGWFLGAGIDPLGRLETRDFLYLRLKVFF